MLGEGQYSAGEMRLPEKDAYAALFAPVRAARADPRLFQIVALAALLSIGWAARAFDLSLADIATIFVVAMATQWAMSIVFSIPFEAKSAIITSLSLSLLLRAGELWPLAAAAFIAISSKFLIRANGKHVFNPANIGIVAITMMTSAAWTTPGQWGTALWLAAIIAGGGTFVAFRAARLDVPLIFLGVYAALIFARAIWLGDPIAIPMLRLQNGALIIFAFFMISDPKTTPDGLAPRALFAAATAAIAYVLVYHFYRADGAFLALALTCLARPLLERFDASPAYRWGDTPGHDRNRISATPAE